MYSERIQRESGQDGKIVLKKLQGGIGRNSEFETQKITSGAQVVSELFKSNSVGFVMSKGETLDDQFFALYMYKRKNYDETEGNFEKSTEVMCVADKRNDRS